MHIDFIWDLERMQDYRNETYQVSQGRNAK